MTDDAEAQDEFALVGRASGFGIHVDELAGFEGIPAAERYLRRLAIRRHAAAVIEIGPPPRSWLAQPFVPMPAMVNGERQACRAANTTKRYLELMTRKRDTDGQGRHKR
jgi:hypothetical protein